MADNFIFFWRLFCILIFLNLKKINVQKQPRSNLGTKRYNIFKVVKSFEVNTFLDRQRTLGIHFHFFICLSQVSFLRMYHFRDTVLGPRNTNMLPSPPIFSLWGRRGPLCLHPSLGWTSAKEKEKQVEGRGEVEVHNVIKMINIRNHTCPLSKE